MNDQRIEEIYRNYLANQITAEERKEFSDWLSLPENEARAKNIILSVITENKADTNFSDVTAEAMLESIVNSDRLPVSETAPVVEMRPRPLRWLRSVAAAAVFLLLGFGAYFIFKSKSEKPEISKAPVKMDIAPGGNRAILTLGNGSKIILDSAHNGLLARQGDMRIVKTDSGQLAYQNIKSEKPADNSETLLNTLSTPRGGQYQLTLPDGTKVWLNAASSITYPTAFNEKERKVSITGEVYFEVVKDKSKPFHVNVNEADVQVLGTHFNINAYPDEESVKTTLLEGSIEFKKANTKNILVPGQQAILIQNTVTVKDHVDVGRVMAWQKGQFEFNQTGILTIMRQISRWYDVDIKYEGPVTKETFFGGINRNLPLSDVLKLLEANGIQFRLENKTLFVISK